MIVSLSALFGCNSNGNNRSAATTSDLDNRVFTFPDGGSVDSGLAGETVTLTFGDSNGTTTIPFRLDAGGATAVGRATITSCDFLFTSSTFAPDEGPQVGDQVSADCEFKDDDLTLRVKANGESATSDPAEDVTPTLAGVVYVESNIPSANANSIFAFRRDDADGSLTALPGSPFLTGGAGVGIGANDIPMVGPFDSDQNIIVNAMHTRLFAVNSGSDSIAVFYILPDGGLVPVAGSPFPSNGINPVSVGLAGDHLYVVNKNDNPMLDNSTSRPNYTGFTVADDGSLTAIPNSTVELPSATQNPTQALVSPDNSFLFGADLFGEEADLEPGLLESFQILADGTLLQNTPLAPPAAEFTIDLNGDGNPDALPLGLQVHPTQHILYVGFVTGNKLGVYTYDDMGQLTFVRAVSNGGALICWIAINSDATRLYTANTGDDTVSVYDIATDPMNPAEMQTVQLKGDGSPFQLTLDSSTGGFLHVVKQRAFPTTPLGEGSLLNVLQVNPDGTLTEVDSSPTMLDVPTDPFTRPQGVAAL